MACEGCNRPHSRFDFDSLDLAGSGLLAFQGPTAAVGAPRDVPADDSHKATRSRIWHVGWRTRLSQRRGTNSAAMPAGAATLADLRKAGVINSREVVPAIDTYMRQLASRALPFP